MSSKELFKLTRLKAILTILCYLILPIPFPKLIGGGIEWIWFISAFYQWSNLLVIDFSSRAVLIVIPLIGLSLIFLGILYLLISLILRIFKSKE